MIVLGVTPWLYPSGAGRKRPQNAIGRRGVCQVNRR